MKLSQLAAKPQLIEITLDDEETVKQFGEALTFHTWDRQPLDIFMKLVNSHQNNIGDMIGIVKTLILDEKGKEIITGDAVLPSGVLVKVIAKVVEILGK